MKCTEKKCYQNKKEAKIEKRQLEIYFKKKFSIYKCDECDYFHLTSKIDISTKQFFRKKKANS